MNYIRILIVLALAGALTGTSTSAQDRPIGYWRALLPYNTAIGVATDGNSLYTICRQSFFTYNSLSGDMEPYSKVEGMSDITMSAIGYDMATQSTVLAYSNSNIDIFKDNTFYNVPDFKIKTIAGQKAINQVYTLNGLAYLSTDIGMLVLDLQNRNIKSTYNFMMNSQTVRALNFCAQGDYFYTVTSSGLFRVKQNSNQIQNFLSWEFLDSSHHFNYVTSVNNQLYLSNKDSLFTYTNSTFQPIYHSNWRISHLDPGQNMLLVCEYDDLGQYGYVKLFDAGNVVTGFYNVDGYARQAVQTLDGSVWVADEFKGFAKLAYNGPEYHFPDGPSDAPAYDIYAYDHDIWIAHGGYTDRYFWLNNPNGISHFNNDKWTSYKKGSAILGDSMRDMVTITRDRNNGVVYAGSFQGGLFILKDDSSTQILKQNSILESSVTNEGKYQVFNMALDSKNNLWMTMFGSPHELYAKTPEGNWYKYQVFLNHPSFYPYPGGKLIIDDNDQKWYTSPVAGGIVVYNDNNTIEDPADDRYQLLVAGAGAGNLPSNNTFSLAKDKNGDIWIGTDNGIGIINCASSYMESPCDADLPIVQYDQFAGYLFAGQIVHSIAVDGANRKWVGTDNGVWLLSPDAQKIIYRFNADNSPLPSDHIQEISIDPITGDVYIGTESGLVCYRSTATEGTETNSNVLAFPNPVTSDYTGTIAIRGLTANADVRITDITGQLVYRTIANGGQAVWNGKDYTGNKPSSGVYLIFVTNSDGSQTYTGKIVFMQ